MHIRYTISFMFIPELLATSTIKWPGPTLIKIFNGLFHRAHLLHPYR
jgi:hypothetical protein